MVHEIDGGGKSEEDDRNGQCVTDEMAQGMSECCAEDCQCLVIA